MRVLLAVVVRRRRSGCRRIATASLDEIDQQARPLLPWANSETRYERWLAPSGFTAMSLWTNEPAPQQPTALLETTPDVAIGFSGYISPHPSVPQLIRHQRIHPITARRGGVFTLLCADADTVRARTSLSGAEPLYYAMTRDHVFIGTRASVVHVVSRSGRQPSYQLQACAAFIQGGFIVGEQTLLENTKAVPPNTLLTVTGRAVREVSILDSYVEAPSSAAEIGRQLAESLVDACQPLVKRSEPVRCAITGGRDSRLMLAALRTSGVAIAAHTYGFADHSDVKVGREVADILGVPHVHSVPKQNHARIEVNPLQRVFDTIRLSDGMLSAYENIATRRNRVSPWSDKPVIGGHGGELYRGGYGKYVDIVTPNTAATYLINGFLRHESLLRADHYQQHKALMSWWIDRTELEPELALDAFYQRYRAGRWSSAARSAYSVTRNLIQPFFDERVMLAGRAGNVLDRLSERVFFSALQMLHEPLATYPFAGHPWRFEARGPRKRVSDKSDESSLSTFNWRIHYGTEVHTFLTDYILSHDVITSFLDLKAVTALLREPRPRWRQLVWHLFTLTALLSNEWFRKPERSGHPIAIPLPG